VLSYLKSTCRMVYLYYLCNPSKPSQVPCVFKLACSGRHDAGKGAASSGLQLLPLTSAGVFASLSQYWLVPPPMPNSPYLHGAQEINSL
jgi:hypothetical protein